MKLSLVTPTLNRGNYLSETFNSLENQISSVQYVVVDGGSTDDTVDIISKHSSMLHWWCSERDNGMYYALNKGFIHTDGEIMGWINSDDILLPGAVKNIIEIFEKNLNVQWITGLATVIDENGVVLRSFRQRRFTKESFTLGKPRGIQQESTFWRRTLWEKTGSRLNTKYTCAADYELWCRFFEHTQLNYFDVPLGAFRKHSNQISKNFESKYRTEFYKIRRNYQSKSIASLIKGTFFNILERIVDRYYKKFEVNIV